MPPPPPPPTTTPAMAPKPPAPTRLAVPNPSPIDEAEFMSILDDMVATGDITKESADKLLADPREYEKLLEEVRSTVSGPSRSPEMPSMRGPSNEAVRATPADPDEARIFAREIRITYGSLRLRYAMGIGSRRNHSDMRACAKMRAVGRCLLRGVRVVGDVPGVHVGDVFMYRAELMVLAVHGSSQAGIDYVPGRLSASPLAICVIASGGYEGDVAFEDVLYYTGTGGGRTKNDRHQTEDQKLERGNLGLASCIRNDTEVRVVRGLQCDTSPSRMVYVYDGLFKVTAYERVRGESGYMVYRYRMERIPGQLQMGSKSILSAFRMKERLARGEHVEGYLTMDLSGGQEVIPVGVFNDLDADQHPLEFEYIARPNFPRTIPANGCSCISKCSYGCSCMMKNSNGCAYTDDGYLVRGQQVVYECGESCSCSSRCRNRLTQKGLRFKLEVFRSLETDWGVRSLDVIPAGSFICEIAGDVLRKDQVAEGLDSFRLIDPASFPQRWREWGDVSTVDGAYVPFEVPSFPQPDYVLNVSSRRNLGIYICNSYMPNVFLQYVIRCSEDERFPHMMIFALENIAPLKEIGIQYDTSLEY